MRLWTSSCLPTPSICERATLRKLFLWHIVGSRLDQSIINCILLLLFFHDVVLFSPDAPCPLKKCRNYNGKFQILPEITAFFCQTPRVGTRSRKLSKRDENRKSALRSGRPTRRSGWCSSRGTTAASRTGTCGSTSRAWARGAAASVRWAVNKH